MGENYAIIKPQRKRTPVRGNPQYSVKWAHRCRESCFSKGDEEYEKSEHLSWVAAVGCRGTPK